MFELQPKIPLRCRDRWENSSQFFTREISQKKSKESFSDQTPASPMKNMCYIKYIILIFPPLPCLTLDEEKNCRQKRKTHTTPFHTHSSTAWILILMNPLVLCFPISETTHYTQGDTNTQRFSNTTVAAVRQDQNSYTIITTANYYLFTFVGSCVCFLLTTPVIEPST